MQQVPQRVSELATCIGLPTSNIPSLDGTCLVSANLASWHKSSNFQHRQVKMELALYHFANPRVGINSAKTIWFKCSPSPMDGKNTECGKKIVVGMCGACSAALVLALPLCGDSVAVAATVTAAMAFTALYGAALSSVTVDLFPTSLRVMAMATFLMCGRLGTIAGTVTFPALITFGCWPPFITIAAVLGVCGMACYLLPNTTLKKLE
ncbi:hypothetical protein evm_013340 [Chilo suppressalis]|nr:hypothetical protein evm_013340 [Chilo suppressalis]